MSDETNAEPRTEGAPPAPQAGPGAPGAANAADAVGAIGAEAAQPAREGAARLFYCYLPHAIIFFSSACVMVVELVAGRLIARHLGSSLYTWTSVIGVVLAGMSIGNYAGGRLADRWKPQQFLGYLFLLASMSCLLALATNSWIEGSSPFVDLFKKMEWTLTWPGRVFLAVFTIFLPPAFILGTISPATAKMALDRSAKVGSTLGSVYAWGACGSILGTFLTGFWLIAALGSVGVVMVTALCLSLIGLALGPGRLVHAVWVALVALLFSSCCFQVPFDLLDWAQRKGWIKVEFYRFERDSNYQLVKVYDKDDADADSDTRTLALDYLVHAYVDMGQTWRIEYDYEKVYAGVARRFVGDKETIDTFFIGGGGYTFPRWVLHTWPGSRCDVAEIDPMVLEACHEALGLPRDTPIRTYIGDARNVVDDLPADAKYDVIFGDAFNDLSVPWHLTTLEFNRKLARHLKPGGVLLVNIIDEYRFGQFLGRYVETLKRTFPHVYVFCTQGNGVRNDARDTFVVAASDKEMDFDPWLPGHEEVFEGSLLTPENLASLKEKSGGRILTDDDAPVENLLAPVIESRR